MQGIETVQRSSLSSFARLDWSFADCKVYALVTWFRSSKTLLKMKRGGFGVHYRFRVFTSIAFET